MREAQLEERITEIKRTNHTDLIVQVIMIIILVLFGRHVTCGIPIVTWIAVYIGIISARTFANLFKITLMRRGVTWQGTYSIGVFLVFDGAFLGWLIYGNVIFWSKADNCNVVPDSRIIYQLMLLMILVGYFQMLVYGILISCVPCIIYSLRNQPDGRPGGELQG